MAMQKIWKYMAMQGLKISLFMLTFYQKNEVTVLTCLNYDQLWPSPCRCVVVLDGKVAAWRPVQQFSILANRSDIVQIIWGIDTKPDFFEAFPGISCLKTVDAQNHTHFQPDLMPDITPFDLSMPVLCKWLQLQLGTEKNRLDSPAMKFHLWQWYKF